MTKKVGVISVLVLSIILVILFIVRTTYSLIIEVTNNNGNREILNNIDILDIVTDDDGIYNSYYYDALRELDINNEEANIIINSKDLNELLDTVISDVVEYRLNHKRHLTDNEIYILISNAVNNDQTINNELKNKILLNTKKYLSDITKYIYDIKTSLEVDSSW